MTMTMTVPAWNQGSQPDRNALWSRQKDVLTDAPAPSSAQPEAIRLWHEGMQLAELCYQATQAFPPRQSYGLDAQIRLTANLIPASVAQSYEQAQHCPTESELNSYPECDSHIERAKRALLELKTHLQFSERLSLVPPMVNEMLLEECDMVRQRLNDLCEAA